MLTTMSNPFYEIWRETRFYYCQPYKRIHTFTMNLIPNDWKHLLKTETSQYLCKGTRKVKDFQKLSNKEIYFTLQSNSTKKHNKPFKFILWPIFLEVNHILSQESLL